MRQPRHHREPDGPGADDERAIAGAGVRTLDRVQPHGQRLHQCAERGIEGLRERDRLPPVHAHVLGEGARAAAHADQVGLLAVRGFARRRTPGS